MKKKLCCKNTTQVNITSHTYPIIIIILLLAAMTYNQVQSFQINDFTWTLKLLDTDSESAVLQKYCRQGHSHTYKLVGYSRAN